AVGAGGVFASQFHLFSHSIFKALLFLGAGAVIHAVGTRDMTKMGGVGKHMPFVKWVFIIGALALSGIPILNGFWSKESVLEAGLAGGPSWIYGVMVLVAGLTALYTIRCVWMVFFGQARSDYHAHKVEMAMKVALAPLALAALVSWLAVEPFSKLLGEATLPQHNIETLSIAGLIHEVLSVPTLVALGGIVIGIILWLLRAKLAGFVEGLTSIQWAADRSFGFEAINSAVVRVTNGLAEALRNTQTGLLNWNVLGILAALIILFAALLLGA
ncbi:hypothetical protein EG834_01405, partial [bacterium]|nr:hypothetical protein [bacterium]